MKTLLIILLALMLQADTNTTIDNMDRCINKIARAKVDLSMAKLMYSWQEYQKTLNSINSAIRNKNEAMALCEIELKALNAYSGMEIEQMELIEMAKALANRLAK